MSLRSLLLRGNSDILRGRYGKNNQADERAARLLQSQTGAATGAISSEQTLGDSSGQWQTGHHGGMRVGVGLVSGCEGTRKGSSSQVGGIR